MNGPPRFASLVAAALLSACASPALTPRPQIAVTAPVVSAAHAPFSPTVAAPITPDRPPLDLARLRYLVALGPLRNHAPGTEGLLGAVHADTLQTLRAHPTLFVRDGELTAEDTALGAGALPRYAILGGLQELTVLPGAEPAVIALRDEGRHHHGHHSARHHHGHHHHGAAEPAPVPAAAPTAVSDRIRVRARVEFVIVRLPQHAILGSLFGQAVATGTPSSQAELTALSVRSAVNGALQHIEEDFHAYAR